MAARKCSDCEKYVYLEDGRRWIKFGLPVLRQPHEPTPCHSCPKVPRDAPAACREHAVEMTEQNRRAWEFYQECKAVGRFPRDPIVYRWAGLLRQVEDDAHWTAQRDLAGLSVALQTLAGAIVMGGRRG